MACGALATAAGVDWRVPEGGGGQEGEEGEAVCLDVRVVHVIDARVDFSRRRVAKIHHPF